MHRLASICLLAVPVALIARAAPAQVRQSSTTDGALWVVTDGATSRLNGPAGEVRLDLPAGATIDDIEAVRNGWLATGRYPAADGSELLLIAGDPGGSDLLPIPPRTAGRYRGRAVLAIDRGELVGLIWLEGDGVRELAVRAADRTAGGWGESELVSPRGPGSQVAPQVTVLADGSWLLVWAAYDGFDDEIVWSRRESKRWSAAQRLYPDNDVPDITPKIVATAGGALAVWSRFDGNDYRLQLARFADAFWAPPTMMGGKGSGDPLLVRYGAGALLLFQTVETRSWWVIELDAAGGFERLAEVAEDTYEKPVLLTDDGRPRLVWPELESAPRPRLEVPLVWRELP